MKLTTCLAFGGLFASVLFFGAMSRAQTTQPAKRSADAVEQDLASTAKQMHDTLGGFAVLLDPAKRAEIAPKLIPILNRLSGDLDELATLQPDKKDQLAPAQVQFLMLRSLLGDKPSSDALQQMVDSKDPDQALQGKCGQLMVKWIASAKDAPAQGKLADELEALAKAHPESIPLTQQLLLMSELGPANEALANRLQDLVTNVMTNQLAENAKMQLATTRKLKSLENKPLVIAGPQVDGKTFSTADWKGKVVLVDFWATWCGPCRAELPRVKKAYSDFHAQGLEVLGVSNDNSASDLTQFLDQDKEMPWPQLFDAAAAAQQQWNPITLGFGINGIPTMFLIDKKGIVRSVSARENFEELIPKLIAE